MGAPLKFVARGETPEQRPRAPKPPSRAVPDIRFLLDYVLTEAQLRLAPVGSVGHSFGGWTALVSPDVMPEIGRLWRLRPPEVRIPGVVPEADIQAELAFRGVEACVHAAA